MDSSELTVGRQQAVFSDSRCLAHRVPYGFPECPDRLDAILRSIGVELDLRQEGEHLDTVEAILAVHDGAYVESFERAVKRGDGLLGSADNPISEGTLTAARAAVDATLHAVDWMMADNGSPFVAVRPPGHHAERDLAMGFCFFNNVAVAAQRLLNEHGLSRVAVFDFDVHHGNGTQHIFEEREEVYYASVHQWPFYPGTGAANERGRGPGEGATLNLPLPAGSGDEEYLRVFEEEVLPALESFKPEVLLVSAGFDAWRNDPVGGMQVSAAGFARWGVLLRDLADHSCGGRSLSLLEGGYDLEALPKLANRYLTG